MMQWRIIDLLPRLDVKLLFSQEIIEFSAILRLVIQNAIVISLSKLTLCPSLYITTHIIFFN